MHYRIINNGTIGPEQYGPVLGNYGRMHELIPNPSSDEIILMVIDNDADTRIMIWNGNSWTDKGEVSTSAQSPTFMSIAGAYERVSGNAMLVYSDNTNVPKYRIWDGASLSAQQSAATGQGVPRWMKIAPNQNTDELLLIYNMQFDHIDAQYWNGNSWLKTSLSTADTTSIRGGVAISYENS